MANYKRKHPRGKHTRENSSDWRYPRVEKGDSQRSRYSVSRFVAKANDSLKQFYGLVVQR